MLYTDYLKNKVSREELSISTEYNAFDWPRWFFGPFNQLHRAFVDKSTTKIEAPHLIVYLLTGRLTEFGKALQIVREIAQVGGAFNPAAWASEPVLQLITKVIMPGGAFWSLCTGETKGQNLENKNSKYRDVKDVWKLFMLNPHKVDFVNGLEGAKHMVDDYVKGLEYLKTKVHVKIAPRAMTIGEKNAIKLLRPEEMKSDMEKAKSYVATMAQEDPKMLKEWQNVYAKLEKGMMDYLKFVTDNITSDLPVK